MLIQGPTFIFFLTNFPGSTFIPCPITITYSRVSMLVKVHIFCHKILRNLHIDFVLCSASWRWRFRKILWPSQNLWTLRKKRSWPQSHESREIFGETKTRKMAPRRDQSRGLEPQLQALVHAISKILFRHTSRKSLVYDSWLL